MQVGALLLVSCSETTYKMEETVIEKKDQPRLLAFHSPKEFSVKDYFFSKDLNDKLPLRFSAYTVVKNEEKGFESFSSSDFYLLSDGAGKSELSNDTLHLSYTILRNAKREKIEFYLTPFRFENPHKIERGDTLMHINSRLYMKTVYAGREISFSDLKGFTREWLIPENEGNLLIVKKDEYKLYYYQKGELQEEQTICLGQDSKGHKNQQGDNRTPEGHYFISQKAKGPFHNSTGPYLGNSWMRVSYPNAFDAEKGFEKGYISETQKKAITRAFWSRKQPPENTQLGGGIGLHGWIGEWEENGYQDMTWGCVCMQNNEIDELYPKIPVGTTLLIIA